VNPNVIRLNGPRAEDNPPTLPVNHKELADLVLKTGDALRGVVESACVDAGLSAARYAVLEVVRNASPDGCSQIDVAQALGQAESSVSTLIERMRKDGLVYRHRSKSDRRKRLLLPTKQGEALLHTAEHHVALGWGALLSRLTPVETVRITEALAKLLAPGESSQPGSSAWATPAAG
jgi:DNA-binding MarR family transcriptional regulator